MPRIDHLKNNPSKIPFPKQTRSSWSNASFRKSPIYYLSRSKINTLITARSIHPYTKTTFLRAVDKVTHHQTISINNQLDPPSTFLCSKKSEKEKKKKTVSRFDSPPFSSSNDPPTESSIASKLFHPFPREAIDHKVAAASMTRTVLAFAIVQPATTHAIPLLTLAIATSSSLLPLPLWCTSSGGALHYFSGSHFRVWRGRPRRAESGVYFEGGRRVHRGRVQWRACSRNWLHGTQCPPRKIGRVKLGQSGKFDTISSGSSAIPPVRR